MRPPGVADVLVVGAGPAGGRLAASLARAGADVVLVDRLADPARNAFSSAAVPIGFLERYAIPDGVVAAPWRGWQLVGPDGEVHQWWARGGALGGVLDFAALRRWLRAGARSAGARVLSGFSAEACALDDGEQLRTWLRPIGGGPAFAITSRWVVDATGERRALIGEPPPASGSLVSGVGVEWLLSVPGRQWRPWAERIAFLLGSGWVRQGYGWVFPMAPGQLKVGVCRLQAHGAPPLNHELGRLLDRLDLARCEVLDRHGGRLRSTVERRESLGRGGMVALGDAASTANLLGGEGIRHAMASADVLAPLLLEDLASRAACRERSRLHARYRRGLRRQLGWRWAMSGRLARRTWLGLTDARADRRLLSLLRGLQRVRAEDLSALLFDYRLERYGTRILPYLIGLR